MEALEVIFKHRSIRKYKKNSIPDDILLNILKAATRAATNGNMQLYSIIITTDEQDKKELFPLHLNQEMVLEAPVLLTFCADLNRFTKWCLYRNANPGYDNLLSLMSAIADTILAAQNAIIAAESYGLGTCILGTTLYTAKEHIKFFNLPKLVLPFISITIGYPDEDPPLTDRLPLEAVIHPGKYQDYDKKTIDIYYQEKENLDIYKDIVKENGLENLAQVFTEKRYTKKDNEEISIKLWEIIKEQGFFQYNE
ncbi:MAG TPA: nitroreductase family protein [Bacteroidales bacterium]|nr:nitroreductase family protein [Bacteroidales bacterium]HPZ61755.1 nitroreductase family protein [Bacteroidales bacterium]HQD59472.1 nitroreductase family protein [Bacteroidales bacterium]